LFITDGFPQGVWKTDNLLAQIIAGEFSIGALRIQATVLWFVLFAVILGYVLAQTRIGNWIQAAGGNPVAAQARGVRVVRTKTMLFVLTSVLSAFAGIASSIRVQTANPNSGTGYELEVIAMVVIGGTALTGGRGTIIGTVLGVLILRSMRNGIVMVGVPGLAYNIFIGAIILGMMALQFSFRQGRNRGT
jgi:simple sugar transport system permease protein